MAASLFPRHPCKNPVPAKTPSERRSGAFWRRRGFWRDRIKTCSTTTGLHPASVAVAATSRAHRRQARTDRIPARPGPRSSQDPVFSARSVPVRAKTKGPPGLLGAPAGSAERRFVAVWRAPRGLLWAFSRTGTRRRCPAPDRRRPCTAETPRRSPHRSRSRSPAHPRSRPASARTRGRRPDPA